MESRNPKLHRSGMEMNMPPRWGFSWFGLGGYNDVAPTELKNGRSAAARTDALIQWQFTPALSPREFKPPALPEVADNIRLRTYPS
jgi:hypothetical protein